MMRNRRLATVVAMLLCCGAWATHVAPTSGAESRSLRLLFLGDNGHHVPARRFQQLAPAMAARQIELVYTDRVTDLNAETLKPFDGLVLYANIDRIEPAEAKALLEFVANGKGFVPLHCASYCFRNNDDVVALIGAMFERHGTGVMRALPTEDGKSHPLMNGYQGFESWDETYVHTRHNERDRTVLEYRQEGERREPWTWVRTHGKGRVFYTAWGHDERTWSNEGFLNLVERGIRWACGDDPGKVPTYADRPEMAPRRTDVQPFEYVEAKIPFYPPSRQWGALAEPLTKLQKPLPAEESLKHFVTPKGFQVELVAADPQIGKPLAMNWDERGRLWLCETVDYPNDLQTPQRGHDRIRICEDTDGDGRADKFTIFAEKLSIPTAIAFYRGGAIVQDGTETVYLKDTDGDDRADLRKVLVTGWALADTHGGVSNFQYGFDNWFYAMQGYNASQPRLTDGRQVTEFRMGFFRFQVAGEGQDTAVTDLEFLRSTNNNTWGLGLSEEGIVFGSTANGNPSDYMPIPNRYYERVRGWSSSVLGGIAESNKFEPISDKVRQVDHHGGFTAAAGHALYTARTWPREYWNRTAFVTEPTGKLVATFVIRPEGAGFRSKNSWNILASDDEWSAPIMAEVGPDGQLWVIDWYNIIVQHNPTPAGYKTGKGNAYEIDLRDKKRGRIYRVAWRGDAERPGSITPPQLAGGDVSQLLAALGSDNLLWRKHAQRLLVERGRTDVVPALVEMLSDTATDPLGLNPRAIHALWVLHGLGALSQDDAPATAAALRTLAHPSAGVRRNALQVLPSGEKIAAHVIDLLERETAPQVILAGLLWIADRGPSDRLGQFMATRFAQESLLADRWILDAATSAAASHAEPFLLALCGAASRGPANKGGAQNDATKRAPLSAPALERVAKVAEHYARNNPGRGVNRLIATLPEGPGQTVPAILSGLAVGWPRNAKVELDAAADAALVALLAALPPESRGTLVNLATRWGSQKLAAHVQEIAAGFLKLAAEEDRPDAERISAAKQLVAFRAGDATAAEELAALLTPRTSAELAGGLIEALGTSEASATGGVLVNASAAVTPSVRPLVMRALLSRTEWTHALLEGLEAGRLDLTDLSLEQKQALASHPVKEIAARVKPLLAKGGGLPNPDRQKVIDELLPTISKTGNAALGKEVFKKTCAKCHTHSGEGTRIGPDLTGMAVHPKHELAIHILDPSRSVEGNFRIYTVALDDGRILTGLVTSESKTAIELVDVEAKKHVVLRENIEELVASKKSLMPEGFEKQHSPQELTDLLEFLTKRGRYTPIPLDKYATITTTKGMFNTESAEVERLIFPDWNPKTFEGVPFVLVDPQGGRFPNAVMLHGTEGGIPPRMPKQIVLPCNQPCKAIHFLSGVSGWGWPASPKGSTTMTVRLHYAGGQTEDHPLLNGQHFADYIRRVDVPGSKFAYALRGQQIRYFAVEPKRPDTIESVELLKGNDITSPVVMAITLEAMSSSAE